jgi:hypothetical protein
MIFVSEWSKGEFVSILIGYILLTKSLLCNVAAFTAMLFLWQVASVTSFMKAISVFKEDSV